MSQQLLIPNDWLPTPDNINALPEPLKKYIHSLDSFDYTSLICENFELLQNFKGAIKLMVMYREDRLNHEI